jgi:hypothetical protein
LFCSGKVRGAMEVYDSDKLTGLFQRKKFLSINLELHVFRQHSSLFR